MSPFTIKTIMTVTAAVFGALALVPKLHDYQAAFTFFAGAIGAWAHGKRPGDMTEDEAAESQNGGGS